MTSRFGALRGTWLVATFGVVFAAGMHALALAVGWKLYFARVYPAALTGAALHVRSMGGDAYPDYVFSTRPSWLVVVGVAAIACAAGIAGRAAHITLRTRWIRGVTVQGGPPYRSLPPPDDSAHESRAAVRAFTIRLSLVAGAALSVTLFGVIRVPDDLVRPARDQRPRLEVAAQTLAVLVENLALTPILLALLATATPTRRRIQRAR